MGGVIELAAEALLKSANAKKPMIRIIIRGRSQTGRIYIVICKFEIYIIGGIRN